MFRHVPDRFVPGWLEQLDNRTNLAREMRERYRKFTNDLGGDETLSYAQRSLVNRALWLEVWLEQQELTLAQGGEFDVARWTQATNALQGILSKLGLEKKGKTVQDLQGYLKQRQQEGSK